MLVLTRKIHEELVIGENVKVVVFRINGNRVCLGIEAPNDVVIRRGEIKPLKKENGDVDGHPAPDT